MVGLLFMLMVMGPDQCMVIAGMGHDVACMSMSVGAVPPEMTSISKGTMIKGTVWLIFPL